jgi:hypothetical protein
MRGWRCHGAEGLARRVQCTRAQPPDHRIHHLVCCSDSLGPERLVLDQDADSGSPHSSLFTIVSGIADSQTRAVRLLQGMFLFRACAFNNIGQGEYSDVLTVVSAAV